MFAQMIVSRRDATGDDREFVRSVHHRAYRDVIERQYGIWDLGYQDRFFDDTWSETGHEIILHGDVSCGYCWIDWLPNEVVIRELVIDPDYQCLGIGTQLLHDVLNDANARGVPVRLRTQIQNRAASLYRRLGFRETNRTDTHIVMERLPAPAA